MSLTGSPSPSPDRYVNVDRNDLATARRVLAVASLGSSVRRKLEGRVRAGDQVGIDAERLFLADD